MNYVNIIDCLVVIFLVCSYRIKGINLYNGVWANNTISLFFIPKLILFHAKLLSWNNCLHVFTS